MHSFALFFLALLCAACTLSCASSAPEMVPADAKNGQSKASPEAAEAKEKASDPDVFCPSDARVYTRQNYRWCKKEGQIHGPFASTDQEGQTRLYGQFDAGRPVGTWKAYHQNGKMAWDMTVEQGEESGEVHHWYEDGTPKATIRYKVGIRDGVSEYFHPNGAKLAQIEYADGTPTGQWTYWHDNGQKAHEYTRNATGKAGIHKHWKPDGTKYIAPVGQLPKDVLLPVLEPLGPLVRACFDDVRVMSDAQGKVVMQLTMGYGGEVSKIDMFDSNIDHPYMNLCARRMGERLRFPHNPYGPRQLLRSWEFSVE